LEDFKAISGKGLRGFLQTPSQKFEIYLGNRALMADIGLDVFSYEDAIRKLENDGKTVMILSIDKKISGALAIADVLKKNQLKQYNHSKKII